MTAQVYSGATLVCSCGLAPSALGTSPRQVLHTTGAMLATVADCQPLVHVAPFGGCIAPANPALLPSKPCLPVLAVPWTATAPIIMIAGVAVLTQSAVMPCAYGGVISIVDPGPPGVFASLRSPV